VQRELHQEENVDAPGAVVGSHVAITEAERDGSVSPDNPYSQTRLADAHHAADEQHLAEDASVADDQRTEHEHHVADDRHSSSEDR
jgi:hypothetical protein